MHFSHACDSERSFAPRLPFEQHPFSAASIWHARHASKGMAMDIRLDHTAVKLLERDTISVVDGKGARIAVVAGSVWITQERDSRDVLLRAGQSFTLDRDGTAIVEALADAEVALDAPSGCLQAAPVRDTTLTSLAVLGYARGDPRSPHFAPASRRA
jgi:hypothetical protein